MSTDTTLASDTGHRLKAEFRIFDCDVHPVPQAGLVSLTPYLPAAWRERFARKQAVHDGLNVPIRFKHPNGSVVRQDARTPEGLPPASSPQYLVADLIEKHNISGALLNCFEAGGLLSVQAEHGGEHRAGCRLQRSLHRGVAERRQAPQVRCRGADAGSGRGRRRDQARRQAPSGVRDLHPPRRFDDGPSLLLADLRGLPGARLAGVHPCHRHRKHLHRHAHHGAWELSTATSSAIPSSPKSAWSTSTA